MKAPALYSMVVAAIAAFTFSGCLKDDCTRTVTYMKVEPVYISTEEAHNTTAVKEDPRELKNPGQIYYYDNTMYIVEKNEGVHVIDNADPSNPINTTFIKIAGNKDIAIKDGLLYADSYTDMLVIDVENFQVVGRAESVIKPYWEDLANNRILVEYVEKEVTEVLSCDEQANLWERGGVWFGNPTLANVDVAFDQSSGAGSSGGTGIAGSLAHFSIIGDYLYTIQHDGYTLDIYDLTQPTEPTHANTVNVGVHLETLFPHGDKLFIGSNVGMYIYDNSDPINPTQLSVFEHARACDPVFVYGNYAYVTLWNGSACGAGPNQLDVIDITDLTNPILKSSFAMENPHGLSVKENTLLLCEGDFGFKSFDCNDPLTVGNHMLDQVKNMQAIDVISLPGSRDVAMVVGADGFYQFDFDNPADLKLLSIISVVK